jgi:hypothetical protein
MVTPQKTFADVAGLRGASISRLDAKYWPLWIIVRISCARELKYFSCNTSVDPEMTRH